MPTSLKAFENICRRAHIVDESVLRSVRSHPFEERNLFPDFPKKVRKLFDDGHYSEATFEALKFLDKTVQRISGKRGSGFNLMMSVFGGDNPDIKINALCSESEIDEQKGYQFMFSGIMSAIRNPKGHEHSIEDDLDTCLDHLSMISTLLRRLIESGHI
ncbi:MAG: TIGR02391 family protein [Rhodobacterales bacterium]|nr:TIGR02391 family protein [Rhodobacterales bacterium]